jgi:hypothetical protein
MRFSYQKASVIDESPALIFLEPESDRDRAHLELLLTNHRGMVSGFGRQPGTYELIHMSVKVSAKTEGADER